MKSTGSFIPSGAAAAAKPRQVRKIYIFTYLIYVFFAVTILVALGIFAYNQYLSSQIAGAKQDLVEKQASFNSSALAEVEMLEGRISQAVSIFNSQVSLYRVLEVVEDVLLRSVTISGFEYADNMRSVTLKMSTSLPDFNAAVYQRTVLGNHPLFTGATIKNIVYAAPGSAEQDSLSDSLLTFDINVPLDTAALRPQLSSAATVVETELVDDVEDEAVFEEEIDMFDDSETTNPNDI